MSEHAHRTKGITGSAEQEGANGDGDVNVDVNGNGAGRRTGVEANKRTQYGNGNGSEDGNESSSGDGYGDEDGNGDWNENGVGEGGGEAKKRKKPHKNCRRDVGTGGDFGRKRKNRRQERVGSELANPDNPENSKKAGGEAQGTQSSRDNCISRVCSLVGSVQRFS